MSDPTTTKQIWMCWCMHCRYNQDLPHTVPQPSERMYLCWLYSLVGQVDCGVLLLPSSPVQSSMISPLFVMLIVVYCSRILLLCVFLWYPSNLSVVAQLPIIPLHDHDDIPLVSCFNCGVLLGHLSLCVFDNIPNPRQMMVVYVTYTMILLLWVERSCPFKEE